MAIYYVRADGSATKVNAIGPATDATKCMSVTTFNASTFAAGDTINFSAQGGTYSDGTSIILPSSGSSALAKITYQGLADGTGGAFPSIIKSGLPVSNPSRSYVIFRNFGITNTGAAGWGVGISGAGATDVTLDYLDISGSGYGVNAQAPVNTLLIDHTTCSTAASYFIYLAGNPSSNITIRNSSNISTVGGVLIRYATNVTVQNNTLYSIGVVPDLELRDCAGALLIQSNTIPSTTGSGNGILLTDSTMTGWIQQNTVSNVAGSGLRTVNSHGPIIVYRNTIDGCTAAGMYFTMGSSGFTVLENLCQNNREDGYKTDVGSYDITFRYDIAKNNGNKLTTSGGDGFTSHQTDYNIFIEYCLSILNTASGYAMVGTSSGHIYNSIAAGNGGNWSLEGGGKLDQVRGGFYLPLGGLNPTTGTGWTLKNNIGMGNYPREVLLTDITSGFTVMDNNCYMPLDPARFASIDQGLSDIGWGDYHIINAQEPLSINADPKFVDSDNEDFSLRYDSPCRHIGAVLGDAFKLGLNNSSVWPDGVLFYGQDGTWDIGAYPYRIDTDIQTILDRIESTLAADVTVIQTDIASLLASIIASGGIGGIITGVVDAGVTVSSSFRPISMEKGEKKVLVYEIKENDVAIDVSAYTFQFGVKRDLYDTTYAFEAVAGVVTANADGVMSVVTFIIPAASTKALAVIESGRYSVGMYDGTGNKAALTPPGGVEFRLTEDILDVA
jgi:hypothetical protein